MEKESHKVKNTIGKQNRIRFLYRAMSMNFKLVRIWKKLIKIDAGSKIVRVVWKSLPNINIIGVPNSNTPVPKMDCSTDVTAIIIKISKSTMINFNCFIQEEVANLI